MPESKNQEQGVGEIPNAYGSIKISESVIEDVANGTKQAV